MHKRFLLAASALAVLAGCGGGGGSTVSGGGGGPAPAPEAAPVGSAKFTVDARTGEVKVEPISASRAAFSGGALSFTSSLLLSEGSPERRVIRVTAKNNTQETIGASGSFKVLFTNFQNANTPLTDLRSLVQTSTFWGNGTNNTTLGGQSAASIAGPTGVDYDQATETLYTSNSAGWVLAAQGGTVKRLASPVTVNEGVAVGTGFRLHLYDTGISLGIDDAPGAALVGSTAGTVDGTFAVARFTNINDCYIYRSTGPNDFEAVVADATTIRRVERTPANPNGLVTTIQSSLFSVNGVTYKDGIFYASTGHGISIFTSSSTGIVGNAGSSGYVDGLQQNVLFNTPTALRWVGNTLFIADSANNRIRQMNLRPGGSPFSANNWWVSTVSGNGTASGVDGTGTFITHNNPVGLAKGPGETLFVADQNGHRIRKITPISNRFLDNFGDSTANPTEPVQLANATDYVPSSPTRTPLIVEDQAIPAGGSVTLGDWQFNLPEGVKSFSFIVTVEADTLAPGVLPSVSNTGSGTKGSTLVNLRTLAGTNGWGYSDGSSATAAFDSPQGICVTENGDIFVADLINSAIRRISKSGKVTTILGPNADGLTIDGNGPTSSAADPLAIACNPDGSKVYFTQNNAVVRVLELQSGSPELPQSWKVTTIAGLVGAWGNVMDTTGDLARLSFLGGLVVIDENTIAGTDFGSHCVYTIQRRGAGTTAAHYFVSRLAGSTTGVSGFVNGNRSAARFNVPRGITRTKSGLLFVADGNNRRIRRLDLGGEVTTFAGSGASGTLDSTNPLTATFVGPVGIAAEPSGYLYVSDLTGKQVRRISPTGAVSTVAGTSMLAGTLDGTGNTGLLSQPNGLAVGPGGDLFITDQHRIRLLQRIITN